YIIGRSGYSTIMDIIALGKKAILLPTPGQTEQEYLATYLMKKNIAFTCSSKSFSLTNVLQAAESFPYQIPAMSSANLLTAAIEELLHQLRVVKK
ncbi:MAG TPA: glycosyltransferase, partial [Chitinophagaceae bacterium]|nr:glycosyltransferase [Chitinophagaceae bacterium]